MPKSLKWDESAAAADNARNVLPGLSREWFAQGRVLASGNPSLARLHRFRLKTKRLRYTLELFRPCYGPSLDEACLEPLRGIQTILGEINDCPTAAALFRAIVPAGSPDGPKLDRHLAALAAKRIDGFRKAWGKIEKREPRWMRYLAKPG